MPKKANEPKHEHCLLCGQEMKGVPQDPYAATAMGFMLLEGQKLDIEQARRNYALAEAVRWCEEYAAAVRWSRGTRRWLVDTIAGIEATPTLPAAVAALRKRMKGG